MLIKIYHASHLDFVPVLNLEMYAMPNMLRLCYLYFSPIDSLACLRSLFLNKEFSSVNRNYHHLRHAKSFLTIPSIIRNYVHYTHKSKIKPKWLLIYFNKFSVTKYCVTSYHFVLSNMMQRNLFNGRVSIVLMYYFS